MIGLQQLAVDLIVLAAALWLAWSFGPESLRRAVLRRRRVKPGYDVALHAEGLDGRPETARPAEKGVADKACGPDCGCG